MPGIVGIIGPGKLEQHELALNQMVNSMMHEDSYSKGVYVNGQIGIWVGWVAHKDSFADGMPTWNEQRHVCLLFSGEVYSDPNEAISIRSKGHHSRRITQVTLFTHTRNREMNSSKS